MKVKHYFLGIFLLMLANILPVYNIGPFECLNLGGEFSSLLVILAIAWWGAIICTCLSVYDLFKK